MDLKTVIVLILVLHPAAGGRLTLIWTPTQEKGSQAAKNVPAFQSMREAGPLFQSAHEKSLGTIAEALQIVPLGFEPRLTDSESVVLPLH
jgi:hypothetical protein